MEKIFNFIDYTFNWLLHWKFSWYGKCCCGTHGPVAAFLSVIFIEILIVLRRNFRSERKKKFIVLFLDSLRLGLFYGFFTESLKLL